MVHEIDERVADLPSKLSGQDRVDVLIVASGAASRGAHGGAWTYWVNGGEPVQGWRQPSDTQWSTRERGVLGLLVTVFNWMERNVAEKATVTIWCGEESVWRWLPLKVDQWVADTRRDNHDLLVKVHQGYWPRRRYVTFLPPEVPSKARDWRPAMLEEARDAKAERAKLPARSRPGDPVEDGDYMSSAAGGFDAEAAQRAIDKDRM